MKHFHSPSQPSLCLGNLTMSSASSLRVKLEATAMGTMESVIAAILEAEVSFPLKEMKLSRTQ